ncbi:LEAF RUST 10 DISEASE-RESISTANCE LOCUS RECEPTOR-LIKE PROTEIN KINASE-like 1.4 isoform X1 [Brassica napus]|uniref:LEAF RUST 10 DISEASE-RESISTANCE LOCUS RECEPTOR-LIKE PROTEIN KINASE-like 1.4 isoform X1 n=1 Tax=Brassica napus TaxID=3708 RepID=UPI0020789608|nr:LEAF RUST 10 DISEASE-RESISTANCE LOCUS RECEPTOR-LIKE PROTEIN KINASE-like 1.4 isoform X1 [Brassica napus]XP_048604133.1 LEAF RUST 10 DISEASE-RESISTANCE LOCUS RECEPTOR-LIKE PROTEIN KINASE-like 1.4 isoform X1 [Brassica napus]XP_048604134.1 LEAF RUST 10 DISEASE-RESISTANCE LOCUS RECEPTOR-LIKE PROTEIN KINASE-like 1.4 isoform X1 [Brassica napus]
MLSLIKSRPPQHKPNPKEHTVQIKKIMYYLPTSSMVLFFIFFLFHHLPCASSKQELGRCETPFLCGSITAGFPFWGGNLDKLCGYPSLELHCNKDITSLTISDQEFCVLQINQSSNTLRLARTDHMGSFCSSNFTNTTLPPKLFKLSPTYKRVTVVYYCNPFGLKFQGYNCPKTGMIFVSDNPENYNFCLAGFTANVPRSFVAKRNDLADLESVLKKGFEVKMKIDKSDYEHGKHSPLHPPTVDELHQRCSGPFSCGNKEELLFYPFWRSGRENCGHPDFKLDCSGEFPELDMSSVKYRILSMSYEDSPVIRLARSDYIGNLCPPDPRNASLSESILQLVRDTDLLTLYYDCNVLPPASAGSYIRVLDCGYEGHRTSYYVTRNLSSPLLKGISDLLDNFTTLCRRNVSIPVSRQALNKLEESPSQDNLENALDHGFELGVNNDCSQCIESGGACGYSQKSRSFICYCVDKPHNRNCRDTGLSTAAKAGIGSAVGLVGVILIAMGLFCLYRRRRKTQSDQYTSKDLPVTSYSSRETSSYPTSTTISSSSNHSLLPSISNLRNGSTYFGVQVFSYEELEEATHNFSRELGDGGFGTVYYGMLKDGRAVAVKRLYERSLKRVEQFKNEIEILKSLKHRNLVILYGCTSRHSRELLLVYEYISNGTLADHLHGDRAQPRPLCWPVRLNVAIETASALSFLHKSGIIHRDVKTTNILLDDEYTVKVADFGLSRLFPMDQTHISTAPQGTPGYVDPEYYQCYRLNEKSDVYSFGVVLTELISSKEAVDITRHRHDINLANMAVSKIQNNALHELVDPSLGFAKDPEVKRKMMAVAELAFRCLQQEREVRPSMDEIVEILKGIKGENRVESSPDVVDIERSGGDDVGLLRHCHSVPPPISPETDKWTSSSDTAASSF